MAKKVVEENKLDKINSFISDVNKTLSKGLLRNTEDTEDIERMPSGCISLDSALGGGYPKGRIIEVYGAESAGKTQLVIEAMIQSQKQGGYVVIIDAEHAFDPMYAEEMGLDRSENKFLMSQPESGEEGLELLDKMIKSGLFSFIAVDSVAALTPKAEIEGSMGDSKMGLQARMMGQAMRKIRSYANKTGTCVMFTNQIREKIGVMFGNPETTSGGNALKFFASVRMDIRQIKKIEVDGISIGIRSRVKIIKNKTAPPFRKTEIDIIFGEGIDIISDIFDLCVKYDIVKRSGAWYSYEGAKLGQGKVKSVELLKDNPELCEELEEKVKTELGLI